MHGASHLHRQNGRFYLRRRVPTDLVPVLGKTEVKRSLDTSDPRVARQRLPETDAEVNRAFEEARRTGSRIDLPSLCRKAAAAVTAPLRAEIDRDPLLPYRLGDPYPGKPDEREPVLEAAADVLAEPWEAYIEAGHVGNLGGEVERAGNIKLPEDRQDRQAILHAVSMAVLKALHELAHPGAVPATEACTPTTVTQTVAEVLELYLKERRPAPRTETELRGIVNRFGGALPLGEVTKAMAREYKDGLREAGLSPGTVNKHIGLLKALWSWADRNDYASGPHPFAGLAMKQDVAAIDQRRPMSREQLRGFLGLLEGEDLILARLAALTGARIGELCQLRRCDLIQDDGVWTLRIGDAGRVKTAQSKRRVPVPKAVLDDMLQLRRDGSAVPLWRRPDASAASKRMSRAIREAGIKDPRVTFHSLRHLHVDACRAVGVKPEIADALHGHSSGAVSARYGSGYPVGLLSEAVERAAGWLGLQRD